MSEKEKEKCGCTVQQAEDISIIQEFEEKYGSKEDALDGYRELYKQQLAIMTKKVSTLEEIDQAQNQKWSVGSDLSNAEWAYKRMSTANQDEQDAELLGVRLQARTGKSLTLFSTGPGGHVPDGTGPHGRGEGPGKGKGDGSGLKKKKDKKKKKDEDEEEED